MSFLDQFLKESTFRVQPSLSGSDEGADEADIEDNRAPSLASSKSNSSEMSTPKAHQFLVRSFPSPIKCNHCTSLMIGLIRQGAVCEVCGFACHISCRDRVPAVCPVPPDQTKRPLGIDPTRGIGTAYEGHVRVPKLGGVKKGWMKQFVVVCDFKLFLYDISPDRNAHPSICVSQVLDMRDDEFSVSSVLESDVIHANKKDIPCIFKVTTSLMSSPGMKNHTLMLAESENEKTKWVVALNELHRILRKNKLPKRAIYKAKEVIDSLLSVVRNVLCAEIIDQDRLVLGTEEGLYCIDIDIDELAKIGEGKKINQIEFIADEQLLIAIQGKQRTLRLIPVGALDSPEVEWVKVMDTKGVMTMCTGVMKTGQPPVYCFCISMKRNVQIYEITRTRARHVKIRELTLPAQPQCMEVTCDGRLCVGTQSTFTLYSLQGDSPPQPLVHPDHSSLSFLSINPIDALCAVELSRNEYLLIFSTLGVYVDSHGRKSREKEVMFPATPLYVSYSGNLLSIYSETHIDVFECASGDWIQTVNLKKAKPLSRDGALITTNVSDLNHIVYMKNVTADSDRMTLPDGVLTGRRGSKSLVARSRRRFSMRDSDKGSIASRGADRRSRLISGPTNFNHISHMGPGEGIHLQKLIDLPTTVNTAGHVERLPRAKSMLPSKMNHPTVPPPPRPATISGQHVHNGAASVGGPRRPPISGGSSQRSLLSGPEGSPDSSLSSQGDQLAHSNPTLNVTPTHTLRETIMEQASPRHSITSNHSSSLSSPPTPSTAHRNLMDDRGSSSYDS